MPDQDVSGDISHVVFAFDARGPDGGIAPPEGWTARSVSRAGLSYPNWVDSVCDLHEGHGLCWLAGVSGPTLATVHSNLNRLRVTEQLGPGTKFSTISCSDREIAVQMAKTAGVNLDDFPAAALPNSWCGLIRVDGVEGTGRKGARDA